MQGKLMIVEDDEILCNSVKNWLLEESYEVTAVNSAEAALVALESESYDLIITGILLPGIDGTELLAKVKNRYPDVIVIVMTSYPSLETAIKAFRLGAQDYIMKPLMEKEIKSLVKNYLSNRPIINKENICSKKIPAVAPLTKYDFSNIIGQCPSIKAILDEVKMVANSRSNVLLLGETGTGKELIARAIHCNSNRSQSPFIAINCSAIPENLLESELFGHAKGAFTGAVFSKKGLFEEADKGTVFLDEIADLSPHLQAKLLRVLDDKEIRPIGSIQSRKVDIRFIAATNSDLYNSVKEGKFREDLYYRLKVITFKLPPLRERGDDIKILTEHFLKRLAEEMGKPANSISEEAMNVLKNYSWPGNIRELQNIIERAVLLCDSSCIDLKHLPDEIKNTDANYTDDTSVPISIEEFTKRSIIKYQSKYSEQDLASMLGITRKALWEKRKKWGILKK